MPMPKLQHLRHPLRTLSIARSVVAARFEMRSFSDRAEREFAGDPRYQLQHVDSGFVSCQVSHSDDVALLKRICAAYNATIKHPESSSTIYSATGWWQQVQDRSLAPVRQALRTSAYG